MNRSLDSSRHEDEFLRQLNFLRKRANAFDSGDWDEVISAATHIRVIVHDTGSSTSLLTFMGIKDSMVFLSSSEGINPMNLLPTESLTMFRVGPEGAQRLPIDEDLMKVMLNQISFSEWWSMPIIKDSEGEVWSRKELVLKLSNKAGGAHLDDFEPKDEKLKTSDAFGWAVSIDGKAVPFDDSPWLPSAQVICKELILTMEHFLDLN